MPIPTSYRQLNGGNAQRPIAIDLFAGAGGLTEGLRQAGIIVTQAIERDPNAAATYSTNHPTVDLLRTDIRNVDAKVSLRRLGLGRRQRVHLVAGGPPCQGFSESNRRTRTLHNPSNHLYTELLRFVAHIEPDWVILENVAGLTTMSNGLILDRIVTGLRLSGYRVANAVLNAADYGVPQYRRRLFVIANRLGLHIDMNTTFNNVTETHIPTVREAISDLPDLPNGSRDDVLPYATAIESPYQARMRNNNRTNVSGNLVTRNGPEVLRRYRFIPEGGNWQNIPKRLLANYSDSSRCHTGIYHRLSWDHPSKVIGNFRKNMLIHPKQNRGLSIREAARLQGFPDSYHFFRSIGFQQQQVADAVPPVLAAAVAKAILTTGSLGGPRPTRMRSGTPGGTPNNDPALAQGAA